MRVNRLSFCRILILGAAVLATVDAKCYFPDGIESDENYPCDPDAEQSVCCGPGLGNICLSNKLCQSANGNVIRGGCTDKDWNSPECPMFCLGAVTGGHDLISCENVTDSDTSYCCDGQSQAGCCDSGVARFDVLPSNPGVWATWDKSSTRYAVVGDVYTGRPSTTSTKSTEASNTASDSKSATAPSTTKQSSLEDQRPSATQSGSESADSSPSLSTGATVGIAVGVGVGVILVCIIAFLLWKIRRNKKNVAANPGPSVSGLHQHQTQDVSKGYLGYQDFPPAPAGGWPPTELSSDGRRAELSATS